MCALEVFATLCVYMLKCSSVCVCLCVGLQLCVCAGVKMMKWCLWQVSVQGAASSLVFGPWVENMRGGCWGWHFHRVALPTGRIRRAYSGRQPTALSCRYSVMQPRWNAAKDSNPEEGSDSGVGVEKHIWVSVAQVFAFGLAQKDITLAFFFAILMFRICWGSGNINYTQRDAKVSDCVFFANIIYKIYVTHLNVNLVLFLICPYSWILLFVISVDSPYQPASIESCMWGCCISRLLLYNWTAKKTHKFSVIPILKTELVEVNQSWGRWEKLYF